MKLIVEDDSFYLAHMAALDSLLHGNRTPALVEMVRAYFRLLADTLPDDIGVKITVEAPKV